MARRVQRVAARRKTTWFGFDVVEVSPGAGVAILLFSLNAAALALRPFTVVRSHFELALRSDQSAAIELQRLGFGIAVVSDQAVSVGITAVPTPVSDIASSLWFVHSLIYADESSITDRTRSATNKSIDSKAMRKVEIGQDIVVVVQGAPTTGSGSSITVGGRMLVKNN